MNALKNSLRTLVALTTLLICFSSSWGFAQVSERDVPRIRKAAEQGNAASQFDLGVRYHLGHGVPQDYEEAVKWSRKAAEQGDATAQYNLGLYYAKGEGVPRDYAEAVKWYRMAAEQGDATSQNKLGEYYAKGEGVPKDDVLAYMWYNLAAASGHLFAGTTREIFSKTMTPEQIAEAQKLSREWKPKGQ